MVRGLFAAVVFTVSSSALADPGAVDGSRMAECYGAYDALVSLGEVKKIPEDESAKASSQRVKAEAQAIALFKAEGLGEELAREALESSALFTRSETRELREGTGIYSIDDIRKIATGCDALLGG